MGRTFSRRRWLAMVALSPWSTPVSATDGPGGTFVLHDDGRTLSALDAQGFGLRAQQPLPARMTRLPASGLAAADDGSLLAYGADGRTRAARRVGVGPCHAATSGDGRWHLVLPQPATELLLLDAALQPVKAWPLPGPVLWLAVAPHRRSFVLALSAPPQLWEISYDERAEDFYEGLVHDFRMGEGVAQRGFHNARRMALPAPLVAAGFDAEHTELAGRGLVFNLDLRKPVARPSRLQPPAAGSSALWRRGAQHWMAVPVLGSSGIECFSTGDWVHRATLETPMPVARVLAHERASVLLPLPVPGADDTLLRPIDAATLLPRPPLRQGGPVRDALFSDDGQRLLVLLGGASPRLVVVDLGLAGVHAGAALAHPLANPLANPLTIAGSQWPPQDVSLDTASTARRAGEDARRRP